MRPAPPSVQPQPPSQSSQSGIFRFDKVNKVTPDWGLDWILIDKADRGKKRRIKFVKFAPLCSVLCIVRESLSIILYQTYSIYILAFLSIFWLKKLVLFEIFPFYLICPTVCDSLSMAERSKFCWDQRLEHSHNLLVNSKQLKTFRYYLFIKTLLQI